MEINGNTHGNEKQARTFTHMNLQHLENIPFQAISNIHVYSPWSDSAFLTNRENLSFHVPRSKRFNFSQTFQQRSNRSSTFQKLHLPRPHVLSGKSNWSNVISSYKLYDLLCYNGALQCGHIAANISGILL